MMSRIKPKSKESIKEAVDIVLNTQDDDSAIEFLRDTLEDDFPDLDLGSMDLHEAIKNIGAEEEKYGGNVEKAGNLSQALSEFMKSKKKEKSTKRTRKKRSKRK